MNIMVSGRNLDVTEGLRNYAEKKLGRIGRYFDHPLEAQVTLQVQRERHIVEVTTFLHEAGLILRAEVATGDMYASVDQAVDKLERQIRKYKTRINRRARRLDPGQVGAAAPAGEEEQQEPQVVKTKRFSVKPMDVDEAILQMDLLGHDFFVFRNAQTQEMNVLYRRRDGNYGLIDPLD